MYGDLFFFFLNCGFCWKVRFGYLVSGIGIAEEELLRFWGRVWGYDVLFFCFQIVSIFW